jgi:excinuclease ABC subunit B
VLISTGTGAGEFEEAATIGHNFEAVIGDLETRMRAAAADLDFEEAARLRDEIKRLRSTELAVMDDPTAKVPSAPPAGAGGARRGGAARQGPHKPALDEMGIALFHEIKPARDAAAATGRQARGPRKPTLDEMGPGVESIPGKPQDKTSGPRSTLGRPGMRGGWKPRRH